MGKFIDLTGMKFGRLTVLKISGRNASNQIQWLCKCSCKNNSQIEVSTGGLKSGNTKSCGCLQKEVASKRECENLAGQTFGRLIVLKDVGRKHGEVVWLCQCSCVDKNKVEILAGSLKSGRTKSCGCLQKERISESNHIDLIGQKFGMLTVIKETGRKDSKVLWLCQCSCKNKNYINVTTTSLRNGKTKSCGCLNESFIASELKNHYIKKYNAIKEYKILKNPKTNHYLPYDIYIPNNNIFIEIQGGQHYFLHRWHKLLAIRNGTTPESEFRQQKILDNLKKKYAKKNGYFIAVDLRKIKTVENAIKYIDKKIECIIR